MTAVVVDGPDGKEYRLPTDDEILFATRRSQEMSKGRFAEVPFGVPGEPIPEREEVKQAVAPHSPSHCMGFNQWNKLFTSRQLIAIVHIC